MDLTDVVVCQSAVRRFLAVRLKTQMKCATMIQATWRRFLASENYILILSDVIVCQSVVRRRIAVMNYNDTLARREVAAVSIQKVLRGFSARINYLLLLGDVVTIQSFVRRMIAMKELAILRQIQWSNEEVAATMIQAAYHGYNARVDYAIMKCQVIILQNAVRSMLARNELQTRRWIQRDKEEDAATKIQAAFHGYTARMDYVIVIGHVITLQTAVRSAAARNELRARRQNKAATKIRAAYIGFITRMNYLISLDSIIICQCAMRVMIAKRRLNEAQSMRVSLENAAATKLQSIFRGYAARIEYIITVSSIITCQAAVRMVLAKLKSFQLHKLQWEREDSAATLIRAAYLGYTARMNYLLTVADIITIQKYVRGHNARILANELILNQRLELIAAERERKSQENAAVRIQKIFRGFVAYEVAITSLANAIYLQANIRKFLAKIELERRRNNHRSVVRIQSVWRSHKAQTNYALVMYAIISIQSIHRRNLAMIKYENAQAQRSSAVVALQSCFRRHMVIARLNRYSEARAMYGARRLMNSEHWACTAIQKWWKQYLIQRNIAEAARESLEKSAATAIQKCFRGYRDCLQFVMMSFSIIQIQSVARSYSAKLHLKRLKREREEFELEQNDAATTIQACFRGYKDFVRFVLVQYFIIKIQSCARSYNARLHLKQKLMHEELKKQQRQEKAAALIIERFFITIKAEIDLEVSRMAMKKHRKQNVVSSNSSAVSQFNHAGNCIMTGGLDAHIMRGKSPARGRMPSYQSVASAPHESAESYRMRSNVPSVYAEHRETDQYPPHQGFRHTALSREQVIRSNGNLDHQRLDINHSHPTRPRRDMRSASPSREHAMPMQNGGHFPTSNCFVDHPHAPRVLQPGYAPQNDVSRDAVVHGGHGMLWAPSPPTPNYDSRGPTINPPLCNGNLPQPHVHNAYHDANIQGSNSFSSASHTNQMQSQYYSAHVEPQARLSPVPQTYYLAGVPNRSQQYLSKPPVQNTYPGHQRYLPTQNRSTHSRHVSNIE